MNFGMFFQISLHNFGPMNGRPVPYYAEGLFDMSSNMLQSDNQFFAIHQAIKMAFVNLARNRQADHGRCFSAILPDEPEKRGLPAWCPSETYRFRIGQTKLIFKHDLCAEPPRFFLSWASPDLARCGSVLHRVQLLAGPVFVHSSPGHAAGG